MGDNNPFDDNQTFDDAYWLHQPAEVRALRDMSAGRGDRALALAIKGFTIDVPIMAYNWDPWKVMNLRVQYGYTWVPSALQPPPANAPGFMAPQGIQPYDPNNPLPGSIKVSNNIADYPPIDPPAPVVAPTNSAAGYVGAQNFGNMYFALAGDNTPDGVVVVEPRGKFLKHRVVTPFGFGSWYELLP